MDYVEPCLLCASVSVEIFSGILLQRLSRGRRHSGGFVEREALHISLGVRVEFKVYEQPGSTTG